MINIYNISFLMGVLSDPTRIRIWMLLQSSEVCVCHIVSILGLANSTISEHLSNLKKADLVDVRRQGKWAYYKAITPALLPMQFTTLIQESLFQDVQIQNDLKMLQKLQGENPC